MQQARLIEIDSLGQLSGTEIAARCGRVSMGRALGQKLIDLTNIDLRLGWIEGDALPTDPQERLFPIHISDPAAQAHQFRTQIAQRVFALWPKVGSQSLPGNGFGCVQRQIGQEHCSLASGQCNRLAVECDTHSAKQVDGKGH